VNANPKPEGPILEELADALATASPRRAAAAVNELVRHHAGPATDRDVMAFLRRIDLTQDQFRELAMNAVQDRAETAVATALTVLRPGIQNMERDVREALDRAADRAIAQMVPGAAARIDAVARQGAGLSLAGITEAALARLGAAFSLQELRDAMLAEMSASLGGG
jgi:hypothetical protein